MTGQCGIKCFTKIELAGIRRDSEGSQGPRLQLATCRSIADAGCSHLGRGRDCRRVLLKSNVKQKSF